MAEENIKSKEYFALLMDRKRFQVWNAIQNGYAFGVPFSEFMKTMKERGLMETFEKLADEFSDKIHEMDWCEDPTCTWVEPKKKDE